MLVSSAPVSSRGFKKSFAKQNKTKKKKKKKKDVLVLLKIPVFIQSVIAWRAAVETRHTSCDARRDPVPHTATVREPWLEFRQDRAWEGQTHRELSVAVPADSSPRAMHLRAGVLDLRGVLSSAVRQPLIPARVTNL